jgi:hypothetical protein
VLALAIGIPVVLLVAPSPFPSARTWLEVAAVVVVACVLAVRFAARYPVLPLAVVAGLSVAVPLAAPHPVPVPAGEQTVDAAYGTVFRSTESRGQDAFDAQRWFVEQVEAVDDGSLGHSMYFWIGSGHGHRVAAAYGAHVSGYWLNSGWNRAPGDTLSIDDQTWSMLESCGAQHIALVGAPADLDYMLGELREHEIRATSIFEGVAPSDEPTRVEILEVGPCPVR